METPFICSKFELGLWCHTYLRDSPTDGYLLRARQLYQLAQLFLLEWHSPASPCLSPRLLLRAYRIQYPETTIVTRQSSVSLLKILSHSCPGLLVPWLRHSRTAPFRCVVEHWNPALCCAHRMAARLVVDLVVKQRREIHGRRRNEIRSAALQVRMLEGSRLNRTKWDGRWCMIRGVFGHCIGASRIRCR